MSKTMRDRSYTQTTNPNSSFSSLLLDQIYRSFDSGCDPHDTLEGSGFYGSKSFRKHIKIGEESAKTEATGRWVSEISLDRETRRLTSEFDHHHRHFLFRPDADQDSLFFSSGSSSSESSSSWFSSSDMEFMYGNRLSKPLGDDPLRPRPVRTGGSTKAEKTEKRKQNALFHKSRDTLDCDGFGDPRQEENNLIKSKSRATKIYNNLKKVKQPISPGGRLASFINSLLTATNVKKSSVRRFSDDGFTRKSHESIKSCQISTCSSASSFSRSCLSKNSPSTRDKLRNGQKRSVTFYPVSVVVGEDSRPCGQKSLCAENEEVNYGNRSRKVSVSVANEWEIGKPAARKCYREEGVRVMVTEKSRRVEEMAREILREYEKMKTKECGVTRTSPIRRHDNDDEDEDDDAMSCSSSELFELDLVRNERFEDELPVYETTHIGRNRAIASGLIM